MKQPLRRTLVQDFIIHQFVRMEFNNPQVAANFESMVDVDISVNKAGVYSGLLSNISPEMASAMVSQQSNLVKQKAAQPADVAVTNSTESTKVKPPKVV